MIKKKGKCPIFGERTDAGLSIGKKKQASLTALTCTHFSIYDFLIKGGTGGKIDYC